MTQEAIILAGGFGTRLRGSVPDRPKPLAPIAGRPFLHFLLDGLARQGVRRAVLAVHHLAAQIEAEIGVLHGAMEIAYAVEQTPMGTGGAVAQALALTSAARVAVLNGDTYLPVALAEMAEATAQADIAMAVVRTEHTDRFGTVRITDGRVTGFTEKSATNGSGWINGGVYIVRRDLPDWQRRDAFSLERAMLEDCARLRMEAFEVPGPFLDIGTPDDFQRAQHLLPSWAAEP